MGLHPNVEDRVRRMCAGFHICYNRGRAHSPGIQGTIDFRLTVGEMGQFYEITHKSTGWVRLLRRVADSHEPN